MEQMNNTVNIILVVTLVLVTSVLITFKLLPTKTSPQPVIQPNGNLLITSAVLRNEGPIPTLYTCDGKNINPPLSITGVPSGVKSLALIVDDPDAPLGTFTHWVVWNISSKTKEILENSIPEAAQQGNNSAGKNGYTGPCPGTKHRYFFTLYALDAILGLDGKATSKDLYAATQGHIVAQTKLVGTYQRL